MGIKERKKSQRMFSVIERDREFVSYFSAQRGGTNESVLPLNAVLNHGKIFCMFRPVLHEI